MQASNRRRRLLASRRGSVPRWFLHANDLPTSSYKTLKFLTSYVHRSTLPQSALRAASSLREGAGNGLHHSTGYSLISGVGGRFSSPLRNSDNFGFHHSTDDTPSVSPAGCQLPQRGSREGLVPFNRVLAKIRGYGRFSSPLRNSEDFGFYHSSNDTPSVSPAGCQLPHRGSREAALTWGWCFRLLVGGRCGWRRAPGGWTWAWPCRGRAGPVGAGRPGRSGQSAA